MLTASQEAFGKFAPVHEEAGVTKLQGIASGELRGYRIFNAGTDEHLITVTVPASYTDEEAEAYLDSHKRGFADQVQLHQDVELAHVTMERHEAKDLLDRLK